MTAADVASRRWAGLALTERPIPCPSSPCIDGELSASSSTFSNPPRVRRVKVVLTRGRNPSDE
eukprot:5166270-Amphidinium_carterae.1